MRVDLLSTIITLSGIVFFAVSLAIIVLGKKVGEKGGESQKIKVGKYVELSTNSVLSLVIITALFSLTPLILKYSSIKLDDYIPLSELKKNYIAIKDLSLYVHGSVTYEDKTIADNVKIKFKRKHGGVEEEKSYETDIQGAYGIPLENIKPDEEFEFVVSKDGYKALPRRFSYNNFQIHEILFKNRDD